ncbi:MAG: phosphatidate cytidylyltransferase [Tahibacter sp.]
MPSPVLKQRTLTALVLAPIAISIILFLPHSAFALVTGIVFVAALWEWTRMLGLSNSGPRGIFVAANAALMLLLWWLRDGSPWWIAMGVGVLWWCIAMLWLRRFSFAVAPTRENTALKLLVGSLIVVPAWVALNSVHSIGERGPLWTLFGLLLIWVADSGAYLAGSRWGRTKIAPRISPGKTWAGVYGALASSAIVGVAGAWLLGVRGLALVFVFLLAMLTVGFSIAGDLFESLIKRHANIKDSGNLFPGHGGLFDRLDSVFAALPVWSCGLALLIP